MTIFEFSDYRLYLRQWIASRPRKGHGEIQRLAGAIRVHPTLVSQVLAGSKHFSLEQGQELGEYLGLVELEHDYLLALLQFKRAGSAKLRAHFKLKLDGLKKTSQRLSERLPVDRLLNDQEKAIFYSDWIYSAIRLQTSVKGYDSLDALSEKFHLPRAKVGAILKFLVSCGLCIESSGRYEMGVNRTHLEQDSPFLKQHHGNWRLKSMQQASRLGADELMFTGPMSLSHADFAMFREELVVLIKRAFQIAKDSDAEQLVCLNIDWIKVDR
jgi:uncharacterized protein (TIGR02147 family)